MEAWTASYALIIGCSATSSALVTLLTTRGAWLANTETKDVTITASCTVSIRGVTTFFTRTIAFRASIAHAAEIISGRTLGTNGTVVKRTWVTN